MKRIIGLLLLVVLVLQAMQAQTPTLEVLEDALKIKGVSRFDIATPEEGMFIYDMFTETIWYYDGADWNELGGRVAKIEDIDGDTEVVATDFPIGFSDHIRFDVNGQQALRLSQVGNAVKLDVLDLVANESLFIGDDAGRNDETSTSNIGIGSFALTEVNDGVYTSNNVAVGAHTLEDLGVGLSSGVDLRSNVAMGYQAAQSLVNGHHNTVVGNAAAGNMTAGSENVLIGQSAGSPYFVGGNNNTILGPYDSFGGYTDFTQSGVVKIGNNAGYEDTNSNVLHIANQHDKSLIYGEFANDYLRIGGELNINNEYSFPTTDGTASQVLTTDGSGNVSWSEDQTGAFENTGGLIRSTGDHTQDDFVFGSDALPPASTSIRDTLMFFDVNKAAFRAGATTVNLFLQDPNHPQPSDAWADPNVGIYSAAFGNGSRASGTASFAYGERNESIGYGSFSGGTANEVNGNSSMAIGYLNTVDGNASYAFGELNEVQGAGSFSVGNRNDNNALYSFTLGSHLIGNAVYGTVVGSYNFEVVAPQSSTADLTDGSPVFIVGNGTSDAARSNAMVVRRDGKVGIGNFNYNSLLNVGRNTGDGITIGTAEKWEDGGTWQLLTNAGLFSEFHLVRDMGTTSAAWDDIYADDFNTISDMRAKKEVQDLGYGLDEILELSTINYVLKDDPDQERKLGLSAQELLNEVPEVVKTHDTIYHEDGTKERVELDTYAVNYTELIPVLIKSIQEQQEQINQIKAENKQLKTQLINIIAELD